MKNIIVGEKGDTLRESTRTEVETEVSTYEQRPDRLVS